MTLPGQDTSVPRAFLLRLVLLALCLYHLVVGALSTFSSELTLGFARSFYGLEVDLDPTARYMLKALGMYALFTGAVAGLALWRPARQRALILALAGLLVLRALTRLAHFDLLAAAFGLGWGQNLFNVGLLVAQAVLLVVCLPPREPQQRRQEQQVGEEGVERGDRQ